MLSNSGDTARAPRNRASRVGAPQANPGRGTAVGSDPAAGTPRCPELDTAPQSVSTATVTSIHSRRTLDIS